MNDTRTPNFTLALVAALKDYGISFCVTDQSRTYYDYCGNGHFKQSIYQDRDEIDCTGLLMMFKNGPNGLIGREYGGHNWEDLRPMTPLDFLECNLLQYAKNIVAERLVDLKGQ